MNDKPFQGGNTEGDALQKRVAELEDALKEIHNTMELEDSQVLAAHKQLQIEIAERKQAEHTLRERELYYKTLVETSPSAILLTDLKGSIRFCNRQAVQLFGYNDMSEVLGKNGSDFVVLDSRFSNPFEQAQYFVASGKVHNIEHMMLRRDGSSFPAEVNGAVVIDAEGFSQAIIVVVQDVSERKLAEQKLQDAYEELKLLTTDLSRSHSLLHALFDGLDDGLLLIDGSGYVQAVNRAFATLLGTTTDQLLEKNWQETYPKLAPNFPGNVVSSLPSGERKMYVQRRYCNADDVTLILDFQIIALYNDAQEVDRVIVHVVDKTEYIKLQTQVVEYDRFATSGRLAASVAHEINTPLQSIQLFLELARTSAEQRRDQFLSFAKDEIQRIGRIVNQLLDLYRPSGAEYGPVDINLLLERLLILIGKRIIDQKVTVERSFVDDIPSILGRTDELMQVFLNLLVNALDAMYFGGSLQVSTYVVDKVSIADKYKGDYDDAPETFVGVDIKDSGHGIDADLQARMFDSFVTTKRNGTGLGLAISKNLIDQHSGTIWVESQVGKGSTFHVIIPVKQPEEDEAGMVAEGNGK